MYSQPIYSQPIFPQWYPIQYHQQIMMQQQLLMNCLYLQQQEQMLRQSMNQSNLYLRNDQLNYPQNQQNIQPTPQQQSDFEDISEMDDLQKSMINGFKIDCY